MSLSSPKGSYSSLPSPVTTPERGRSKVSHRSNTYANQSPSTSVGDRFGASYFPSPAPSPTRGADDRHRAQLASYKRDPTKAAAASRLSSLSTLWGGAERRLSAVVENGNGPEEKEKRKRLWFDLRLHLNHNQSRIKRYLLYIVGAFTLYHFILRPMFSSSHSTEAAPGSSSAGSKAKPHPTAKGKSGVAPLHARSKIPNRAPLPPGVIFRSLPDHPVENGLLKVNPESQIHPVYQLIRDAREAWDKKVLKQSKTLKEAVAEYKRRYQRLPPKGFDKWWEYVCENDVQLPDEYDQIHRDLHVFRALSPRDLQKRIEETSQLPDTYTLSIRHGSLRTSSTYDAEAINGADDRLAGQAELITPIAKYLDDLQVVFSVHDTPWNILSWDHRSEILEHIEEDEWIHSDDEIDLTLRGWKAACPPSSRMHTFNRYAGLTSPTPSTDIDQKTFIANHASLLELCDHPELIPLHGVLSGKNPVVRPLTPIFSLSKTHLHSDILGVPTEQFVDDLPAIPWSERTEEKLLWRGSNTGAYHDAETTWRTSHRTRLLRLTNLGILEQESEEDEEEEGITLLPAPKVMRGQTLNRLSETVPWGQANAHYMDLAFTNEPLQCSVEDGTCDDLREEFRWAGKMTHEAALRYKYVVDVDGNAWSARFKRLLTSGSLIFKSTVMPEWWTDRIQPWVHYVPVQVDYSDLYDALVFFRGDENSRGGESELAREIATAGRDWSLTHWRKEDMTAYMFRLYLEWARLVADRRGAMDFVFEEGM